MSANSVIICKNMHLLDTRLALIYVDAYVRDLATERRIRLAAICLFACIALFVFINPFIFLIIGEKGKNYRYLLRVGEFFVLCFLISRRGALPSVCIPEKFIYLGEWWEKSRAYLNDLMKLGEIPCAAYQKYTMFQVVVFALALAGMAAIFVLGRKSGLRARKKH